MSTVYSGLADVMDDGELIYFGEEYSTEYLEDPDEELDRLLKKEERRLALERKKAERTSK